jgi:hypothetical protein
MNQKNSSKFKCITKKNSCKIGYLNKIKERIDINLNINKKIRKKKPYKKALILKNNLEKKRPSTTGSIKQSEPIFSSPARLYPFFQL